MNKPKMHMRGNRDFFKCDNCDAFVNVVFLAQVLIPAYPGMKERIEQYWCRNCISEGER